MSYFKKKLSEKKKVEAPVVKAKAAVPPAKPVDPIGPPVVEPKPVPKPDPPPPPTPIEARLHTLELLVGLNSTKIAALQEIPTAHDARLNALETLVRAQASDIVNRATALAAAMTPGKKG